MKSKVINLLFLVCVVGLLTSIVLGSLHGFTYEIFGLIKASTAIQLGAFMCSCYIIYSLKPKFGELNKEWMEFLIVIVFFLLLLSAFETLFCFGYWFTKAIIGAGLGNLDKLEYLAQSGIFRGQAFFQVVSLNLMCKFYSTLFVIFSYFLYTLMSVKRENSLSKVK